MPIEQVKTAHEDQKRDFFGQPPTWIVKYGISLLATIFILVVILANFIRYPDVVEEMVLINGTQLPQRVTAPAAGEYRMLVKNEEIVEEGSLLGYIETSCKIQHLKKLESQLKTFLSSDTIQLENLVLGELQQGYETFRVAYYNYKLYISTGTYLQIVALEKQIDAQRRMNNNLKDQIITQKKEFLILGKQYERDKKLLEMKVLAPLEFEKTEQAYLIGLRSLQNIENSLISGEFQVTQYISKIAELKTEGMNQEQKLLQELNATKEKLKSDIEAYKKKYWLVAFMKGKVSYLVSWSPKLQVQTGQEMMGVVADESQIKGNLYIDSEVSAKIKKGQKVQIRLLNYPYEEYGIVEGEVANIASISTKDKSILELYGKSEGRKYRVEVYIKSLTTSHKKRIPFEGELEGKAKIITKDYSLLERALLQVFRITQS
ncbi:MAG: HlyD family secretion protein [Raineya sp.]|jgi:HlyD family secretion protein|nr:HlyD family secretion protein [Raineya sp.]